MIGNWANWEIWAKGALCARGGWFGGCLAGSWAGVSCTLVARSLSLVTSKWSGDRGPDTAVKPVEGTRRGDCPACSREQGTFGRLGAAARTAAEVEAAVRDHLRGLLRVPGRVADVVTRGVELGPMLDDAQVMARYDATGCHLETAIRGWAVAHVRLLVEKVTVSPQDIELSLRANGVKALGLEL
jgi:hypothetical protein